MTLNLQHPFYLSRYALLLAFLTLPFTAKAQETTSQEFSYGQLPEPAAITRIISSGPPTDQLLFAVAPEKLAGFSSLFLRNEPLFAPQWRALPKLGRISGRGSTLSPEGLLALAPDMIIDSGLADETYRSQANRFSRQTGIPYLLLSGNLSQTPDQLRRLAPGLAKPRGQNSRHSWLKNGWKMRGTLRHGKHTRNASILPAEQTGYKPVCGVQFTAKPLNYWVSKMSQMFRVCRGWQMSQRSNYCSGTRI